MRIRAATIDDIAGIQGLNRELDGHHAGILPGVFRRLDGDARPDSVVREWIEDPEADYLVAEAEGRIIGYLNLRKSANPKYPMFCLTNMR